MSLLFLVNKKIALEIIAAQVFMACSIVYLVFLRKKYPAMLKFFGKHGILLAWLASVASVAGSLFYSQIAGFTPCSLCWWQRIFMYPLVLVLGIALLKKYRDIADYALSLAGVGLLISLYHNAMNYGGVIGGCQLAGAATSCTKRYVFEFGYITIPMMALTVFALIIIFLVFSKLYSRNLQ